MYCRNRYQRHTFTFINLFCEDNETHLCFSFPFQVCGGCWCYLPLRAWVETWLNVLIWCRVTFNSWLLSSDVSRRVPHLLTRWCLLAVILVVLLLPDISYYNPVPVPPNIIYHHHCPIIFFFKSLGCKIIKEVGMITSFPLLCLHLTLSAYTCSLLRYTSLFSRYVGIFLPAYISTLFLSYSQ